MYILLLFIIVVVVKINCYNINKGVYHYNENIPKNVLECFKNQIPKNKIKRNNLIKKKLYLVDKYSSNKYEKIPFRLKKMFKEQSISKDKINQIKDNNEKKNIGIIGATGAVGNEIIKILEDRNFPCNELILFTSKNSEGKKIDTKFGVKECIEFDFEKAKKLDICLLAVGGEFSKTWAKKLSEEGVIVIDNSSAFRQDADVPLVIPEINLEKAYYKKKKLICNPNCTTAIALIVLWPLHKKYKIKKIIMSTYQAASGAGYKGIDELMKGFESKLKNEEIKNDVFCHPLAFNIIPHIDEFQENLYTKEEMKVNWETKKILDCDDIKISCTSVRIPTIRAHSEAITIETEEKIDIEEVKKILNESPGVKLLDKPKENIYPMPLTSSNNYDVEVGRIRKSLIYEDNGIDLFISGDQLLRGAALNAVLIAEGMIN